MSGLARDALAWLAVGAGGRMTSARACVSALVLSLLVATTALADGPLPNASAAPAWVMLAQTRQKERLDQFDRRITDELRKLAPDAVDAFERANRARDAQDHATAAPLFAEVLAKAPTFSHA